MRSIWPNCVKQLSGLAVQIFGIFADVAARGRLAKGHVFAHGVQAVDGKLRMMPVDHRVVEADLEPLAAERLHHGAQAGRAWPACWSPCSR